MATVTGWAVNLYDAPSPGFAATGEVKVTDGLPVVLEQPTIDNTLPTTNVVKTNFLMKHSSESWVLALVILGIDGKRLLDCLGQAQGL
jgi:hypothetical protein